jgi:catechol 2,3-dioxygenase-like lactoylglutathione lyase family enzyme
MGSIHWSGSSLDYVNHDTVHDDCRLLLHKNYFKLMSIFILRRKTMRLAALTFLVRDYDEAIQWFVEVLGFVLLEDTELAERKRWVRVAAGEGGVSFLLAKAAGSEQEQAIGKAAGGRVGFFLNVDDFDATHARLKSRGVHFREEPRHEAYGTVAVFDDLYGNGWDLIGPSTKN